MNETITQLTKDLLAANNITQAQAIAVKLQAAIRDHVDQLRDQLKNLAQKKRTQKNESSN